MDYNSGYKIISVDFLSSTSKLIPVSMRMLHFIHNTHVQFEVLNVCYCVVHTTLYFAEGYCSCLVCV